MEDLPDTGFALVCCTDRAVVAYFESFPICDRAIMYRKENGYSFMPLEDTDIVGKLSLFTEMMERAGYRRSSPFDIIN